ncbi:MAG: S41 family peptidase [Dysgonamonadaceae bacterium]|jgi:carboxyl-terminal processing protease|nr:S41 family peptidase [Dysgonamonadaceae bacterium]
MKLKKKSWWIIISILLSLITGFIVGSFVSGKSFGRKLFFTSGNKINVILDIVNEDYVDAINMKDLTEKAIVNIVEELDPHSIYILPDDLQAYNEDMEGHFGGIGADFIQYRDTIVITGIVPGGPSDQVGLLRGDRIITINDSLFVGDSITVEKILNTVKGKVDTALKISVKRNGSDTMIPFEIKRGIIPLTTVPAAYQVAEGVGFIKIFKKFSHTTYKEFLNAMAKLTAQGCHSFIIDLRMNGGGAMDAAINITNEFLSLGNRIVYMEGKAFPREESFANGTGTCQEGQLVILMDQMSASASEIVAGAIQDNDRGLIIGRRSFGKGLVQNQIELSDGSALRLTIARYYTPSGRNIQRKYKLGKIDEYNQDWIEQFANGEVFHEDSIKVDKSLEYYTVHGRKVYGGGGIVPDIFVPIDTTDLTTYYIKLETKEVFNKFAFFYSDSNREKLNTFKNYKEMLEYLKTQSILSEITRYAEENGIKRRSNLITKSSNQILVTTYAYILHHFFGDEAFYPVFMSNDPVVKKAVEVIQKGDASKEAIISGITMQENNSLTFFKD